MFKTEQKRHVKPDIMKQLFRLYQIRSLVSGCHVNQHRNANPRLTLSSAGNNAKMFTLSDCEIFRFFEILIEYEWQMALP